MRDRDEIIKSANDPYYGKQQTHLLRLALEVLLDIRDLLREQKND